MTFIIIFSLSQVNDFSLFQHCSTEFDFQILQFKENRQQQVRKAFSSPFFPSLFLLLSNFSKANSGDFLISALFFRHYF